MGSLELIVLLECTLGLWNIRAIVTASPRVTQVGLGEGDLCCNLRMTAIEEEDPFGYARGRVVIWPRCVEAVTRLHTRRCSVRARSRAELRTTA